MPRRKRDPRHPYVIHHVHLHRDYTEILDALRDKILPGTVLTRAQVLEHIVNSYIEAHDYLIAVEEYEEEMRRGEPL